jgi:hypothetical protein
VSHDTDDELTPDEAFKLLYETSADILKVDTTKPRPWTRGMRGLMRPGSRALWLGPFQSGKSLAALTASADVMAAGGEVVYIDMENGLARMAERLHDLLAARGGDLAASVREEHLFTYLQGFDFKLLEHPDVMAEAKSAFGGADLLVLDSLPKILARLGYNEAVPANVSEFMVTYIDPLVGAGAAVLALDNTGWSDRTRARGASSKADQFELAYIVSGGKTCSRAKTGTVNLKRTRWRDGDEFENLSFRAGDGVYTGIEADDSAAELLTEVRAAMTEEPQFKTWVYASAKAAGVKIRKAALLKLLDDWAEDPDSGIVETPDGKFCVEAI